MSTKNALLPAPQAADAHVANEGSELASNPSHGCASDVQFLPRTRFKLGELVVELSHCLSMNRLVVRELESGFTRVVTRTDLRPIERAPAEDAANRQPAFENITETQLEQLNAREDELRPYLDGKELTGIEAHRLGKKLGVTARTVRRWLSRYKRYGDATELLPRQRGRTLGAMESQVGLDG